MFLTNFCTVFQRKKKRNFSFSLNLLGKIRSLWMRQKMLLGKNYWWRHKSNLKAEKYKQKLSNTKWIVYAFYHSIRNNCVHFILPTFQLSILHTKLNTSYNTVHKLLNLSRTNTELTRSRLEMNSIVEIFRRVCILQYNYLWYRNQPSLRQFKWSI